MLSAANHVSDPVFCNSRFQSKTTESYRENATILPLDLSATIMDDSGEPKFEHAEGFFPTEI